MLAAQYRRPLAIDGLENARGQQMAIWVRDAQAGGSRVVVRDRTSGVGNFLQPARRRLLPPFP